MKYLIVGRKAKEFNELENKYKELEKKYYGLREKRIWDVANYNDKLKEQEEKYKREIDALYTSLADKDETIQKLQSKIDILHEYYSMDEEPSQEIRTKMYINERIHDLELENIELRNNVRMRDEVQKQVLTCALGQAKEINPISQINSISQINPISQINSCLVSRPPMRFTDAFGHIYYG